ncbi:membrane dipeptidase [Ramlibacter monticola]|uniref:Membrane dipeptidase n=1 Tax=Ramlibacter monticola TaxID=1926872 RepID=A0A936YWZ0_9BURK|nr:membrane dipeptidase [Ramlibacter monticola]MBL0390104.1 membrane dipeptidase [Ramlibacter monticola]
MHSHYGMFLPRLFGNDLARHMSDHGVTLLAWAIVDDRKWISAGQGPLRQVGEPRPGELWAYWNQLRTEYEANLQKWKLQVARTPADIDAALSGAPRVLLACESANFLEGQPERLQEAHGLGVRQLQLVHYIRSPLGDHQTAEPTHNGLSAVGARVVAECKRLGILLDLAHDTASLVDAALDESSAPMIWSHSWISPQGGTYGDPGYIARSLAEAQARKITARGGVVGLWCLRQGNDPRYPVNSKASYADEIMRMCDLVGPQHVGFGTDMEGVWPNRMMNDYGDLHDVVENLLKRGLPEATLHGVFIGNYARALRNAVAAAA